jgi:hypothetical protein
VGVALPWAALALGGCPVGNPNPPDLGAHPHAADELSTDEVPDSDVADAQGDAP